MKRIYTAILLRYLRARLDYLLGKLKRRQDYPTQLRTLAVLRRINSAQRRVKL